MKRIRSTIGLIALLGLWHMFMASSFAMEFWLDELRASLIFYQAQYPEGNWVPYLDKLDVMQNGLNRGDQTLIRAAMEDFLTMLRSEAYGIDARAAHALFWITLGLQPRDPPLAHGGAEMPRSG
jgi:hypothetical protein